MKWLPRPSLRTLALASALAALYLVRNNHKGLRRLAGRAHHQSHSFGSTAMQDWLEPLVGAIVLAITLLDVFLTVLYARAGTGLLAPWLARGMWLIFRAISVTALLVGGSSMSIFPARGAG